MYLISYFNSLPPDNYKAILDKKPDKVDLLRCLVDYQYEWRAIGRGLRVRNGELESLQRSNKPDKEKLAEVLQLWYDSCSSPYTWRNIITVLESSDVNLKKAVEEICSMLSEVEMYKKYSKT